MKSLLTQETRPPWAVLAASRTQPARRSFFTHARLLAGVVGCAVLTLQAIAAQSIARIWDEEILSAIRIDKPHPPVHARNLFSLSTVMYDAWAAYDPVAVGYVYRGKATAADVAAARREAISYAAYRMLKERYAFSKSAATTLPALDARMTALGYSKDIVTTDPSTPAGVGNAVYAAVHSWFINDGALQTETPAYADVPAEEGGYASVNGFLNTGFGGTSDSDPNDTTGVVFNSLNDVNHWQPLRIANAQDQNGLPTGPFQEFLGSQWLTERPFALPHTDPTKPFIDPGPPPQLGTATTEEFRAQVVENIRRSSQLTPDDGVMIDISPATFGDNSLNANDGAGHPVNPATGQPYAPNVVKRGDYGRVLAEFWADGPNSETPPGHWNTIANGVSDTPGFQKRIGGTGPVLDDLEWDVKLYFAVNASLHDAACTAWSIKRAYDGWRPLSPIRHMGQLGQSSDPTLPSYHTNGLPLIPGLIELVTADTAKVGGRHAGLTPGKVAVLGWPGQPATPASQHSGVKWLLAENWTTYQKGTFVTPSFPGYTSGHSTFSRAAAEVLTEITGSKFFPGGLGTFTAKANAFLANEQGPSETVILQWATYYDAADLAGLSRQFGGIHPPVDDFTGRRTGSQTGKGAWALAKQYMDGSVTTAPIPLSIRPRKNPAIREVSYETIRGLYYKLQSAADLSQPFTDEPGGFTQALESSYTKLDTTPGPAKYYLVVRSLTP
ncbi:MAG TPA: vanadium-dependent haloperoxidase [Candidatus Limnocylindria bacterium]|nr:vanadium-dependent haloperoxidase [Candidatus Limnocylindria bacterium]